MKRLTQFLQIRKQSTLIVLLACALLVLWPSTQKIHGDDEPTRRQHPSIPRWYYRWDARHDHVQSERVSHVHDPDYIWAVVPVGIGTTNPGSAKLSVMGGNVGIGTNSPGAGLHVSTHGTKTLRVDKWRRGGTMASFGGNGDFEINAPNVHGGRFIVKENGRVGIGRPNPEAALHVSTSRTKTLRVDKWQRGGTMASFGGFGDFEINAENIPGGRFIVKENGRVGIGRSDPNHPLEMGSGAYVTVGGVWTDASSRDYKENIHDLTIEEAMSALEELRPMRYNYKVDKEDEFLGFISEDVPELVATKDRKSLSPMDITAVLAKVVKEQQRMIEEMAQEIEALKNQ